ncbi:MAG: ABC transporter permease [Nitrospirota bacterium]|nr:ABC transporter permease [Nitrospirota bacterium]
MPEYRTASGHFAPLSAVIAAAILAVLLITALAAPLITRHVIKQDPYAMDLDALRQPPGKDHLLGTDSKGRDLLARIVHGSRISLFVGFSAAILSLVIGVLFGLTAGYFGGMVDLVLSRIFDIFLAFPSLLLAIGISAVIPPGLGSAMLAITLVSWAGFARLIRGMTLSLKELTFVEASQALGASTGRTIFRHILPNAAPLLLVAAGLRVGGFILIESSLSFLGLGVQPPTPTWGSMISLNRAYINAAPWMVIFPGLAISMTVIACNILGDHLRDRLDPRFPD